MAALDVGATVTAIVSALQASVDIVTDTRNKKSGWRWKSTASSGHDRLIQDALGSAVDQISKAYAQGNEDFGFEYRQGDGMYSIKTK